MEKKTYKIFDFTLDVRTRQLLYNGESARLSSKAFDVLLLLVEKQGEIVGKNEIMEVVWSDSFVEESNLAVQVSALRRIFREKQSDLVFIKTIPGSGYSFVAPVREINSERDQTTETAAHPDLKKFSIDNLPTIAVLPFIINGKGTNIEYLAAGLAQSLISDLSRLPGLRIISYSAVRNYNSPHLNLKEIGFLLGVEKIITGHIAERGGSVEISIELVDAENAAHLWGMQSSFDLSDILKFKQLVCKAVIDKFEGFLPNFRRSDFRGEEIVNSEAYNLYLKGRYMLETISTRDDIKKTLRQALVFFKRSLKRNPSYAQAYAAVGEVYVHLFNNNLADRHEAGEQAGTALAMAIALDENLSEAYVLKGTVQMLFDGELPGAEKSFADAVRLNPNNAEAYHWQSLICVYFERFNEAFEYQTKAVQLAPTSILYINSLLRILYYSGDYAKAVVQAQEILELDSRSIPAYYFMALSYAEIGVFDEALKSIEKAQTLRYSPDIILAQAYILGLMGKSGKAAAELFRVLDTADREQLDNTNIAAVYAVLGKFDEAFDFLDKARREKNVDSFLLNVRPQFINLRRDKRFKLLAEKLGLG